MHVDCKICGGAARLGSSGPHPERYPAPEAGHALEIDWHVRRAIRGRVHRPGARENEITTRIVKAVTDMAENHGAHRRASATDEFN
jgi:hypothetical protein